MDLLNPNNPLVAAQNLSQAAANPVPDGRARKRTLRLVDGALINSTTLFALVEESFDSFLDPNDMDPQGNGAFKAYGYIKLERVRADVPPEDANHNAIPDAFEGNSQTDTRTPDPQDVLSVSCNPDLIGRIPGVVNGQVTPANATAVVTSLLRGQAPSGTANALNPAQETVHYLCVDTGLMDGGKGNRTESGQALGAVADCGRANGVCEDSGPGSVPNGACALGSDAQDCAPRTAADRDSRVGCPAGSQVIFFTVRPNEMAQADLAALPCQLNGTCGATLQGWRRASSVLVQHEPLWKCTPTASGTQVTYCSDNRLDLRWGKTFYAASSTGVKFRVCPT